MVLVGKGFDGVLPGVNFKVTIVDNGAKAGNVISDWREYAVQSMRNSTATLSRLWTSRTTAQARDLRLASHLQCFLVL